MSVEIQWTRPKLERLKEEYEKHKGDREATFTFDGHVFVVGYAKYLIEYLEQQFR
jgi:hypothetical protein